MTFVEILSTSLNIIDDPPIILSKKEILNSGRKLGKNNGFRLWLIIDRSKETVTLCDIYSIRGKLSQIDLTRNDRLILLQSYLNELVNKSLKQFDINNLSDIIDL